MNVKNLSCRFGLKRAWLAGTLLLLLVVGGGCNSDRFVVPPADEEVMTMAAMGLNCQEGTPSFQVNEASVRMRTGPGLEYPAYGLVHLGESYAVMDISEDRDWVAFVMEDGRTAWIYADLTLLVCM